MLKWKTTVAGNQLLEGKDKNFYVSYNNMQTTWVAALLFFRSARGTPETALVVKQKKSGQSSFWILDGDFRKEYENAIGKGLKACMAIYRKHAKAHNSDWTNPGR